MKIALILFLMLTTQSLFSATDPTSLKITVHQVAVSLSEDCTNPKVIFTSSSAAGTEKDFLNNPTIGSGSLDDGTYHCMMITMNDVIKFTPVANEGNDCVAGTEYSIDLCRDQASSGGVALYSFSDVLTGTTATSTECAGTAQAVSGGGLSNKVTLYLRTNSLPSSHGDAQYTSSWKSGTAAIGAADGTNPTTARPNGIQLSSPFVVAGSKIGVFYMDATGQVTDAGTTCEMNAPVFGFRDP